jgi:hypothetical protein
MRKQDFYTVEPEAHSMLRIVHGRGVGGRRGGGGPLSPVLNRDAFYFGTKLTCN